ncbi:MAG: RNA polymerase sigma factor [Elusimicrobia bacterium]|nr:RNA polymerase sigma factor [Elusimicrobiota bacterium]
MNKRDDKFVFNDVLNKYEKPLINYLYKFLGSRQDAEDAAQETFLRVYQAIDKYEPTAKFSTYLYRIATNFALNLQRRRKIIKFFSLDWLQHTEEDDFPVQFPDLKQKDSQQILEEEETTKKVRIALSQLPSLQKSAVILSFYENKSYQEISEILQKSIPSVESLIFRAKSNLRKKIKNL